MMMMMKFICNDSFDQDDIKKKIYFKRKKNRTKTNIFDHDDDDNVNFSITYHRLQKRFFFYSTYLSIKSDLILSSM